MDTDGKINIKNIVEDDGAGCGHHHGGCWGGGWGGPFLGGLIGSVIGRRGGLFGGDGYGYGHGHGHGLGGERAVAWEDKVNEARYEGINARLSDMDRKQDYIATNAHIDKVECEIGGVKDSVKDASAAYALGLCKLQHDMDKCCCETNRNIDCVKLEVLKESDCIKREVASVKCGIEKMLFEERERALYAKVQSLNEALERKENKCSTEAIIAAIKHSGEESREAVYRSKCKENSERVLVEDIADELERRRFRCHNHRRYRDNDDSSTSS